MKHSLATVLAMAGVVLGACEPAPSTQALLASGFGDTILDDGAVLFFDPGQPQLPMESERQLVRMMPQIRAALAKLPDGGRRVCIAGHTDNTGSEMVNQELSLRRAEIVAARLVDFGMARSDIVMRGYGNTKPFIRQRDGAPEAGNRIVTIARGERCAG